MSLKKIAELAGTSVSTVSRVLNHPEHQCNNHALQEKIWRIAEELHYSPNLSARNLRIGQNNVASPFVVDIFLARFQKVQQDDFFMELWHIIQEELLQNQCILGETLTSVDIMNLANESKPEEHVPYKSQHLVQTEIKSNTTTFVQRKKDTGLVILGKCPEHMISIIKKRYAYIVGIDRNPTEHLYDEIVCNGATATEKALKHLISLGHKNIAYIGDCSYEARYIGYYQTLLDHNLPLNYQNIYPTEQTKEEGYDAMLRILEKKDNRPTAIFCANDTTALGVLDALKKKRHRGYTPSVISIDDIEAAKHSSPMLTTISIPKREMGHLAIATLLDRKNQYHKENIRIELPCHLVERESCDYNYL